MKGAIYMEVLNMGFGYSGEYMLEKIFAMNQHWNNDYLLNMQHPRPTSALLYIERCELEYMWDGGKLEAKKGEIVYIPQDSVYKTRFSDTKEGKVSTVLIEFRTLLSDGTPFVFFREPTTVSKNASGISEYFEEMVRLFMTPVSSPSLKKSVLYRILSTIGYEERTAGLLTTEFASIADGIMYMENDINQEKNISEIAQMCHVSPSYFRKLFRKYSGMSPMEYQIQVKLSHAKRLLQTNTMRISEISDMLGFFDPAYFCRLFKKYTGISPKDYAKKFIRL